MNKKKIVNVVFWHNDFQDTPGHHGFYSKDGVISKKVFNELPEGTTLIWHFHGGFINPESLLLLKRMGQADVLIADTPWNMDLNDNNMHWSEAQASLLKILTGIKDENKKLKIFFIQPVFEPESFKKPFEKIGEFVDDIHDAKIYNYFKEI